MKATLKLEGFDEVVAKLRSDHIYAYAWRRLMTEAAKLVKAAAQGRAPVGSGAMRATMTYKIEPKPVPLYAVITLNQAGKRYGFLLNAGKGKGGSVLHYRGTKKRTRRWFIGAISICRKHIQRKMNALAQEIQRTWQR